MTSETSTPEVAGHLMGIAEDFERMGSELRQRAGSDPFAAVAELALQRVPAASCVSITTLAHERFTTAAATDDVARRADLIQYELGSGPCVDAILDDTIYRPADLEHDTRWPEYGAQVSAELGLHSMLSYRMSLDTAGLIAGLNFYGVGVDAFSDHDVAEGLLLTTHAAQVVSAVHLRVKADNLEQALESNRDIGTAIGVLMGQYKLGREQAFTLLRIASQNGNRKLREVALDVIDTGTVDVIPHVER